MAFIEKYLSHNVRNAREKRGWTQADLSADSGVSLRAISDLEGGKRIPRKGNLKAIQNSLGLSEEELFRDPTAPPEEPSMSLDPKVFAQEVIALMPKAEPLKPNEEELLRLFSVANDRQKDRILGFARNLINPPPSGNAKSVTKLKA